MIFDPAQFAIAFACLAAGGILKGATGAGAPLLAVPALAMMFDVRFAVVVMLVPNLLTNLWQAWHYRRHRLPASFLWVFALAGAAGIVLGTFILAYLPQALLSLLVALAVVFYIALRLARPNWQVAYALASRLNLPAGLIAGMLQGASGISAPVSITFLNAMRLERPVFISTIAVLFAAMTAMQVPALGAFGLLSGPAVVVSLAALVPLLSGMPVGAALARRLSKQSFDRAILILLSVLALKLLYEGFTGLA